MASYASWAGLLALRTLVRESIANPCMDLQKSTDTNMDIHDFWMSVFNYPYKHGYPHWYPSTNIHARTFRNGYPQTINIHKRISMIFWISVFNYPCFYGYPFGYPWISMDILGFLWISIHWLAMDPRSRAVYQVIAREALTMVVTLLCWGRNFLTYSPCE